MKHVRMLAAMAALAMLAAVPAHAETKQINYVAAPGLRISNGNVPVGVGGYAFTLPKKATKFTLADVNGNDILVTVCQEGPSQDGEVPSNCGDGDDVDFSFCSKANGNTPPIGSEMLPNVSFTVFVLTADPSGACEGVGTAGTLTVTY